MSYNIVVQRTPPYPPYTCQFINIDAESVPAMLAALTIKAQKYWWKEGMDREVARWMLNKQKASFLMPCGTDIVNAIDRLYVMLDARVGGILRDVEGTGTDIDPYVYTPALAQTTDPVVYELPGMQFNSVDTTQAMRNLLNGDTFANYPNNAIPGGILQAILDALTGMSEEDQIELLQKIVVALGGVL